MGNNLDLAKMNLQTNFKAITNWFLKKTYDTELLLLLLLLLILHFTSAKNYKVKPNN